MTKPTIVFRCTNLECNSLGRQSGGKSKDGLDKTTDEQETIAYAKNNPCVYCGSALRIEKLE